MTWFSNHFGMLFSGIAGTAVVALMGWLLKSLWKPAPRIETSAPSHFEPTKAEQPLPNFVFVGGKRKSVFISPFALEGFCDPRTEDQRSKSVEAFVLKFENRKSDSKRKLGRALNVIAKMKFHHENGVTARDIDYGVWLNSPCNSTDMGIGDTRELVLMSLLEDGLVTFEDRRIDNRHFRDEGFGYVDSPHIEGYDRVDITLIDQNSQASLSTNLKFWREGASFCTSEL